MPIHDRKFYLTYAESLRHPGDFSSDVASFFAKDADINVVHPFNQLKGAVCPPWAIFNNFPYMKRAKC